MERLMKDAIVVAVLCLSSVVHAQEDYVELVRTDPTTESLPCPGQEIEFKCHVTTPSHELTWTLPTNDTLAFGAGDSIGKVRYSSDNVYRAILTGKMEDDDPDTDKFNFTSTLLVLPAVNGSTLSCTGGTIGNPPVTESTSITLTGVPDPPTELGYNDTVVIENSVDLHWTGPSYTGGVPVTSYTISGNGRRESVFDRREAVGYSTSGVFYGEVQVSALNTCGQESQPTAINIPAEAMPRLSELSVPLTCEDDSSSWQIVWMYGEKTEGVVYPGEVDMMVALANGTIMCPDVTLSDTSCTVYFPRDVYNISITQSNDIGPTVNSGLFDTRATIVENVVLEDGEPLSVTLTVNSGCPKSCLVIVSFGTKPPEADGCGAQVNVTSEEDLSPGGTETFSTGADTVSRDSDEVYCFTIILCGNPVGVVISPTDIPPGTVAGLVGVILLLIRILLIVLAPILLICFLRPLCAGGTHGFPRVRRRCCGSESYSPSDEEGNNNNPREQDNNNPREQDNNNPREQDNNNPREQDNTTPENRTTTTPENRTTTKPEKAHPVKKATATQGAAAALGRPAKDRDYNAQAVAIELKPCNVIDI